LGQVIGALLQEGLRALFRAREAALAGAARGLVFQLSEALGSLPAMAVASQRAALAASDRRRLAKLGVRCGTESVFLDGVLKGAAAVLRGLLWAVWKGETPPVPPRGTAAARDRSVSEAAYAAMGWRVLGPQVLRVDRVERLAATARRLARQGPFAATPALAALAGTTTEALTGVLTALGYRAALGHSGTTFHSRRPRKSPQGGAPRQAADGPFAKLRELQSVR
jgi:ATP-dependent RNA helicase SUPV3L1/SUV3